MSELSRVTNMILVVVAIVDLAIFSNMTILTLVAFVIGALGMILGIQYSYRSASVVGLFITGTAAAASRELVTILDAGPLIAAISGLMIPMFVLAWMAFSVHEQESYEIWPARRRVAESMIYGGIVLASAPVISFFLSLVIPSITTRFTTVTEVSIMLIILIASGLVLARERSVSRTTRPRTEETSDK